MKNLHVRNQTDRETKWNKKKSCDRIVWTQHIDWIAEKFCDPLVSESYRKKI